MNNLTLFLLCFIFTSLVGLSILALWNFYNHLTNKAMIYKLKRKLLANPSIGKTDIDGTYLYEENGYHIRYAVVVSETAEKGLIEWISIKYRLKPSERAVKNTKGIFAHFWHSQNWLYLPQFSLLILLLSGIGLFYFGLIENEKSKIERVRWVVSRALGVSPSQVRYSGENRVHIAANRTTAVDGQEESVTYNINLWRWLCLGDIGYITRWRGIPYGYDTNRLISGNAGNIWLKKEGQWQRGIVTKNRIEWEKPQGTGIREGKIMGHKIYLEDKKEDKKIRFTDHVLNKIESKE